MRSSIGIDVAADATVVFALARDVTAWERLLPHYARSRPIRREPGGRSVVAFVARRPLPGPFGLLGLGLPVAWRARCWSEPATDGRPARLRFVHLAGATRGMDVTWSIEPRSGGCRVTIEHDFRPRLPGLAAAVDRWFTEPIAGRTLATFRTIAEATAAVDRWSSPAARRPAGVP